MVCDSKSKAQLEHGARVQLQEPTAETKAQPGDRYDKRNQ
jgi:hypothetical protein